MSSKRTAQAAGKQGRSKDAARGSTQARAKAVGTRKRPAPRLAIGGGTLIVLCLGLSLLIRSGEVVAALAAGPTSQTAAPGAQAETGGQVVAASQAADPASPADAGENNSAAAPADYPETSGDPPSGALLAAIQERTRQLDEREAALRDREQMILVTEQRVAERLQALEEARARLAELVKIADDMTENDINQLVAMYETMKPKQASAIFNEMTAMVAAGFLGRMNTDAASFILGNMEPRKAFAVSVALAGRGAEATAEAANAVRAANAAAAAAGATSE